MMNNKIMRNKNEPKQDYELEIWKRLWQSRDFELSHFWQRSVFLSVFLLLVYTAYGALQGLAFNHILSKGTRLCNNNIFIDSTLFTFYTFASLFICTIGILLSILWIFMAKGSKNAYEAYEWALKDFKLNSKSKRYTHLKNGYLDLDEYDRYKKRKQIKELGILQKLLKNTHLCIRFYRFLSKKKICFLKRIWKAMCLCFKKFCLTIKDLFSLKAARYSLSGINISLGYISLLIFIFLAIFHAYIFFTCKFLWIIIAIAVVFFLLSLAMMCRLRRA